MDLESKGPGAQPPETEPGMNIISADFDLIMVNRPNERLYGKPMVALLGKKCYREFEKRDEPCPHCPGRRSLQTGDTHVEETEGLRDDGTWFSARVRTHPVRGLGDVPTGFIEVVEDITEEKRAEKLGRIEAELRAALTPVQNVRRALTLAFQAALRVESIDAGGVFLMAGRVGDPELVASNGLPEQSLRVIEAEAREQASGDLLRDLADAPRSVTVVPIIHRGEPVAAIVAASTTYPAVPPTLVAGLHSLGATVAGAIGRIWAEQSRGDAIADLESVITHAPIAAFVLDPDGRVTMWNKAAERLFGWKTREVMKRPCPFPALRGTVVFEAGGPDTAETLLNDKDGRPLEVRLTMTPFRDVVGVASTVIVMVEDLSTQRRLQEIEAHLAALADADGRCLQPDEPGSDQTPPAKKERVLLLMTDPEPAEALSVVLGQLGYEPQTYVSLQDAIAGIAGAEVDHRPFGLGVVELVGSDGSSGLQHKTALETAGLHAPVIVSSDAEVRGYREHGFGAAVRRPYQVDRVREAVESVMRALDRSS